MLVDASYGIAISLVSARPPCVRPKCIRIWSATRTPLHKLLPFSVLVTSQEHGVLVDASYGIAISLVSARPPCVRPKCIRIWSATRTPLHKLLPFSVLVTSQEHGVLVDASYGIAISLVSARPPCVRPKCIRIWSATRTPLHKLLPFSVLVTSQEHGVLVVHIRETWIAL